MKTHLNTLFVTTEGSYLSKEGRAVVVRQADKTALRVPIHMLESVVCFGRVKVSAYVMAMCASANVSITFLEPHGRFLARVEGPTTGNVLLRKDQFRASENREAALDLAKTFVQAKIHNCRLVLVRAIRDHGDLDGGLREASGHLDRCRERSAAAADLDELRGREGEAARHYFRVFPTLLRSPDEAITMGGRSRRPPRDPVNALLSFTYALIVSDARSACEAVGLDPQVGFLHADRPGRPGLALDLAEEFRPVLGDRVVLSLVNRRQITASDFSTDTGGAVRLTAAGRRTLLSHYQKRKDEEIKHPFLGERVSLGLIPLLQARLLARTLRGELDAYPAFLWR